MPRTFIIFFTISFTTGQGIFANSAVIASFEYTGLNIMLSPPRKLIGASTTGNCQILLPTLFCFTALSTISVTFLNKSNLCFVKYVSLIFIFLQSIFPGYNKKIALFISLTLFVKSPLALNNVSQLLFPIITAGCLYVLLSPCTPTDFIGTTNPVTS